VQPPAPARPSAPVRQADGTPGRKLLTVAAQAVSIVAGILSIVGGDRVQSDFLLNPGYNFPKGAEAFYYVSAGVGILVALMALALWGRARWLGYLQICLWLATVSASIAVYNESLPYYKIMRQEGNLRVPSLSPHILLGDIPVGIAILLLLSATLARSRRLASLTPHRPRHQDGEPYTEPARHIHSKEATPE
jgi:hypothetical protein